MAGSSGGARAYESIVRPGRRPGKARGPWGRPFGVVALAALSVSAADPIGLVSGGFATSSSIPSSRTSGESSPDGSLSDGSAWEWVRGGHVWGVAARGPGIATTVEDGGRIREHRAVASALITEASGVRESPPHLSVPQDSGIRTDLLDVQFLDPWTGFAVGGTGGGCADLAPASLLGGTVLRTDDGGRTWRSLPDPNVSGERMQLEGVAFSDALHGAVVGWQYGVSGPPSCPSLQPCKTSAIFVTFDGGETWTETFREEVNTRFTAITWWDERVGWASRTAPSTNLCMAPDATLYRTTDGGLTWTSVTVPVPSGLWDVRALPPSPLDPLPRAVAVGKKGCIVRTIDGTTWSSASSPTTEDLLGVSFGTARDGFAVGENGTILHTQDGGANWLPLASPFAVTFEDVAARGATEAWVAGTFGTVMHTKDRGATWDVIHAPEPDSFDVQAFRGGRAIAVGGAGIVTEFLARGERAVRLATVTGDLLATSFADERTGWAGGKDGSNQNPVLYATQDGGATWIAQDPGPRTIRGIHALDPSLVWTTANEGIPSLRSFPRLTLDGGATWIDLPVMDDRATEGVLLLDPSTVFLYGGTRAIVCQLNPPGREAAIWRSTDGGQGWTEVFTETTLACTRVLDLAAVDAATLVAVGALMVLPPVGGFVVRSDDGGATWTRVSFEVGWSPGTAASSGAEATWVAGGWGQVRVSRDAGRTWALEETPTTERIRSLSLSPDEGLLWAIGSNGVLLRRRVPFDGASPASSEAMRSTPSR